MAVTPCWATLLTIAGPLPLYRRGQRSTSICDHTGWSVDPSYTVAMGQAFTSLTVGSAFWHGSHTRWATLLTIDSSRL